jgi:transposase
MTNQLIPIGIDMAKATFVAALLTRGNRGASQQFSNDDAGFAALLTWLSGQSVTEFHACLESTNVYGQGLAVFLYEQGHRVSIVNPACIRGYGQSQLRRTKNDQADAMLIARFCRDTPPRPWQPQAAILQQLQSQTRRLGALTENITQEKNRLKVTTDDDVQTDIKDHITFLEAQEKQVKARLLALIQTDDDLVAQHQLLTSIVGVGDASAAILLAEIGAIERYASARQLAAAAGVTPQERLSGTTVNGKTRLCKIGNVRLRTALYYPALTLIRYCEPIQVWRNRLLQDGKTKMQVVGAVMHKLIRIVFGVLKSRTPFDPAKLIPTNMGTTQQTPATA